jgi:two-component system, LytTR family, response regulator
MIRSLIVDDEKKSCNVLKSILNNYCPDVEIVSIAHSAEEGRDMIKKCNPDLVFLDIQMPTGNGFSLLMDFERIDFRVIFVTAHDEFAINAIKYSALDYLLKPINIEDLISSIDRFKAVKSYQNAAQVEILKHNLNEKDFRLRKIALSGMEEIVFVNIDDIIRLEAHGNYTVFYISAGEKFVASKTLKNYEDVFPANEFLRVHNSHIINLNKVKKYLKGKGGVAVMNDGSYINISPRKKDDFLRAYNLT